MPTVYLMMHAEEANEHYKKLRLFSKVNRLAVSINNSNPNTISMVPIDLDNDEILIFFTSLESSGVQYLLVGDFAVAFHGYIRATQYLDLWIKDEPQNLQRLRQVLISHGVKALEKIKDLELVHGFTHFAIGDSGFVIDPMKNLKAFNAYDFDTCYSRAASGEYQGVKFKVISQQDLLTEKQATNRPKDQGDIEYLKNL